MEPGNLVVYGESPIFSRVSQYISTILNRLLVFLTSTVLHRYRKSRLSRLPKGDIKQVNFCLSLLGEMICIG